MQMQRYKTNNFLTFHRFQATTGQRSWKKDGGFHSDEKLADSVRRYPVLYGKSCAVFKKKSKKRKKKCLERCSMQKIRYFWVHLLRPLSILYTNTTKRPKLHYRPPSWKKEILTVLDCACVFCLPSFFFFFFFPLFFCTSSTTSIPIKYYYKYTKYTSYYT